MDKNPRPRVLVIDDEPLVAEAIARMLEPDYDVEITTRPRDGVQRVLAEPFAAVLCDLMMPEMTGMDVHAAVAKSAPDRARRIIFMTGGVLTLRAHDFLKRVDNPCLEKPLDPAQLTEAIRARAA